MSSPFSPEPCAATPDAPEDDKVEDADKAPVLLLTTLGAGILRIAGQEAMPALGVKSIALIAFVALQPGQVATRDMLVDLLWGRSPVDKGRTCLRQELRRMRRALGPAFDQAIIARGGRIALRKDAVDVDALRLETAAAARGVDGLAALLDLCGGAFLGPLSVSEMAFQDWVAQENSRLEALTLDGLLRLMLLDEGAERLHRAIAAAHVLLRIDPLQEDVHAALIRIHASCGRIALARAQIDRCRDLFMEELGEPPGIDLEALLDQSRPTRRADPAAVAPSPARSREDALSQRPLIAVRARGGGAPGEQDQAQDLAERTVANMAGSSWMRIQTCDELLTAAMDRAGMAAMIDYVAMLRLEWRDGLPAANVSVSRRHDGAVVLMRRITAPPGGEIPPLIALARQIAAALSPALLNLEMQAEAARPDDFDAVDDDDFDYWRALMRARRLFWHGGRDGLIRARDLTGRALERHPSDCAALCLLASTHLMECWMGWTEAPRDSLFIGREIALRAVRDAPDEALSHHTLGAAVAMLHERSDARGHQLHALKLLPSYSPAKGEIARLLALDGACDEACDWADLALTASPMDPNAPAWIRSKALAHFAVGNPGEALQFARESIRLRPNWVYSRLLGAACLIEMGDEAEARRILPPEVHRRHGSSLEALRLTHPFEDQSRSEALTDAFIALTPDA